MLDVFHIPSNTDNTKIFYTTGGTNDWQTWIKPRGAKFIQVFCLGAGGSGATAASAAGARNGASGGGSGGITKALIPAFLLPDTLYIQVGLGGIPSINSGTGAATGTGGGNSYISLSPSITISSVLIASSTNGAAGGSATVANGSAGATVFTSTVAGFSPLSIFNSIAGVAGNANTNGLADATGQSALASSLVTGGCPSGAANTGAGYAGGSITAASVILLSPVTGSAGNGTGSALPGANGYTIMVPFCSIGGAGGGGTGLNGGTDAQGGDAGLGSGGGATGAGQNAQNRRGGRGGDGLVIITTIT
jgi:hypothetical protein